MVRHFDAIFTQGAFRPVERVVIAEGTRVHLSVEEATDLGPAPRTGHVRTPRLAHSKDAADFVMEIRERGNAGV
jgi:predicted DNA-binding antitoxin AbrB/MazE fold protein